MERRTHLLADLEVRLYGDDPHPGQRLEFHDFRVATAFVARRMSDRRDAHVLRALAGELGYGAGPGDDSDVVARLAAALVAGRLTLVRPVATPAPALRVGEAGEERPKREEDRGFVALQEPPPTHWIEIQLVGEDGLGIAGERYLLVTPDGVERRGFTDSLGVARVSRIPTGDCKISFPDLDSEAWEPL